MTIKEATTDEARRTVNALYEALEFTEDLLERVIDGRAAAQSLSARLEGNRHAKLLANAHFSETRHGR